MRTKRKVAAEMEELRTIGRGLRDSNHELLIRAQRAERDLERMRGLLETRNLSGGFMP